MKLLLTISFILLIIALATSTSAAEHKLSRGGERILTAHDVLMRERLRIHEEVLKLGLTADVTATIEESLFQKILAVVVPIINEYVAKLVIPGGEGHNWSFNPIHFTEFNIGSLAITFAAPDKLAISLDEISFSIPQTHFDVWVWIIVKATCAGNFWASMTGTTIAIEFDAANVGGKLQFSNPQSNVVWGNLSINHHLDGFCNFLEKVLELFIGNLNNLIRNVIEKDLPAKIGPLVETKLNAVFEKIPLSFVGSPTITSSGITVTVDLIPQGKRDVRPALPGGRLGLPARDLSLDIPAQSLDNLLVYKQPSLNFNITLKVNNSIIKDIFPAAYASCPSCPLAVEVKFLAAPTVVLVNDTIGLNVQNMILGVNFAAGAGKFIPFVDLTLNTTVNLQELGFVNGSDIYFQLQILSFVIGQYSSAIGPIDVSLLTTLVNIVLGIVVPTFNKDFKGIPLPAVITNGVLAVNRNQLKVGFDVNV